MKEDFPGRNPEFGDRNQKGELGDRYEKSSKKLMSTALRLALNTREILYLILKVYFRYQVYFMYYAHPSTQFP